MEHENVASADLIAKGDTAVLLSLADKCERASGADRALDAEIAYQHHGFHVRKEGHPLGRKCYDATGIEVVLPRYTASLDAAMSLVPEGWRFELTTTGFKPGCSLVPPRGLCPDAGSYAATPALALCAAAIRARATLGDAS